MNNNENNKDVLDVSSNKIFYEHKKNINEIKNNCEHEWITDLIDIHPDKSQIICYCIRCEVTKD